MGFALDPYVSETKPKTPCKDFNESTFPKPVCLSVPYGLMYMTTKARRKKKQKN